MNRKDLDSIYPNPQDPRKSEGHKPRKKLRLTLRLLFRILLDGLIVILIIFLIINWRSFRPYYDYLKGQAQHVIMDMKNSQTPTPSPVSTTGWQTLKNQKYCYEVSYPSNWIYYPWESPITKASTEAFQETLAFDLAANRDNSGGDIRILTFKEDLESAVKDVKNATELSNTGPNKLVADETITLNNKRFRKLTYSRFQTLPSYFDRSDLLYYYLTSSQNYSYAITIPPYPSYSDIDQKMVLSFTVTGC